MHRRALLGQLDEYRRRYPGEAITVDRVRDFVVCHRDCFLRSQQRGHITGSAWLADASGRRVLLTHHRKLGLWVQLGGHADGETDVLQVALTEAREESGIERIEPLSAAIFDLDVHPIPARAGEPAHWHYDIRYALRARDERYRVSAESHDLAWVEIDAIARYSSEESMLRMARKWRARQG